MILKNLFEYFLERAYWVDMDNTPDRIDVGSPHYKFMKVGVGWNSFAVNLQVAANGRGLFTVHEPSICDIWFAKANLRLKDWVQKSLTTLHDNFMALLTFHDTWDVWPKTGVHDSWARLLGLSDLIKQENLKESLRINVYLCLIKGRAIY